MSDEKCYVDNAMNRSLGRAGMPLGSMVVSSKGSGESFSGTSYFGSSQSDGETSYVDNIMNRGLALYSRESCASSNSITYVDNAMNQSLRRVGMPIGSMPVSKSSGRSSASSKTYVDNEYNRRLGRVGMEHGSMVVSKDSRIASSKGTKQYVDDPKSRSSSTSKSYVDNEYIKRHGRVGLKHSSMDASKDSGTASSKEMKHYVDNTQNRILGRVGLPYGADAEQVRVYKDNSINRKLGRDGLPIGVAVQSNSKYLEEKSYVDNPKNRRLGRVGCLLGSRPYGTDSEEVPVYKGNLSNRKLGRAGLTIGAAVQSKSKSLELKFYTDNRENRRLGRVGFPSGSRPKGFFSELKKTFCDNDLNKQLGTAPVTSRKKIERFHNAYQRFREKPVEDIDFGTLPTLSSEDEEDAVEQIEHVINRLQLEREWKEKEEQTRPVPKTSHDLLHYSGPIIEFSEINLGKIIGIGGFGMVYHGTYKDYVVAVRMVHVKRDDGRLQEELFDEVKILSKLDNPFIVKFIGACTIYPNLCIVMEYMQMSLHEALHVNCTDMDDITDDDRLMIIIQTLSGLKYLHDKNFAHCDIKPGNILIDHDGEKFTVAKLSDFGLNMMKNEIETSLSSDNKLACHPGTTVYSSPERLRREYLNLKKMKMSDMYSYGLVVFEILCGVQPFSNLSLRQLQLQVGWKHMYPEFPDDIYPNVHLAAKLLGCWDREPENRPTTTDFLKVMNRISCVYETLD